MIGIEQENVMPQSTHHSFTETPSQISRRHVLQILAAGTGTVIAAGFLPGKWLKPVVKIGVLPVHAQTSGDPEPHTQTFAEFGTYSWIVPEDVTTVEVLALGASGGSITDGTANPGRGGRVSALLPVTPGETLTVTVGECPPSITKADADGSGGNGGLGGGGAGGNGGASVSSVGGAGGGGASWVLRSTTPLIVAGGGGGVSLEFDGGDGGGTTGAGSTTSMNGGGGTTNGVGGPGSALGNGSPGTERTGGAGGNYIAYAYACGGGGGGGGYGGGGGGSGGNSSTSGAGGGGASYIISTATELANVQGDHTGSGQVVLTWE
jgi:hypothetical protein